MMNEASPALGFESTVESRQMFRSDKRSPFHHAGLIYMRGDGMNLVFGIAKFG